MNRLSANTSPEPELRLWMENGHGRLNLAPRMQAAAPELHFYADNPRQVPPGGEHLPFPEPEVEDKVAALNSLIDEHGIDILWPQDAARQDLRDLHCEVHVPASPEAIALVDDKVAFNEWLGDDPRRPDSTEAIGAEEVSRQYELRRALGKRVCVKPVIGVSSNGYWMLDEDAGMNFLDTPEKRRIHPDIYLDALAKAEETHGKQRLVVMEWLPGPEVSIDLLAWRGEPLIHAARTSLIGNRQLIQSEHETIDHARELTVRLGMHGILNAQYLQDVEGNWKMLEINPRPAGGSIKSEDAGFGIVSGWARLLARKIGPEDIKQYHDEVLIRSDRTSTKLSQILSP